MAGTARRDGPRARRGSFSPISTTTARSISWRPVRRRTAIWLAEESRTLQRLHTVIDADVWSVVDLTADGQLDLVGLSAGRRGALERPGDARLSLSGRSAARAAGGRRSADQLVRHRRRSRGPIRAAGPEADDRRADRPLRAGHAHERRRDADRLAERRAAGRVRSAPSIGRSSPSSGSRDRARGSLPTTGPGMRFVTDFLWRSPLGLRINAQDTAGVTQTEDWVKIRGDQLAARDGALRRAHHRGAVGNAFRRSRVADGRRSSRRTSTVFVDERFAREAPALAVQAMRQPQPVAQAWDRDGPRRDRSRQPRRTAAIWARSSAARIRALPRITSSSSSSARDDSQRRAVVARRARVRSIRPTAASTSRSVRAAAVKPRGLSLEAQDATGRWVVVAPDLGFPAGKNKTILIDLQPVARAGVARRAPVAAADQPRDLLGLARRMPSASSDAPLRTSRLRPGARRPALPRVFARRGIEQPDEPEIPIYDRIANTVPRWRDLVGYYTRFGDVRELLGRVDDRYVIMNAGDELRLSFPAPAAAAAGLDARFRAGRRRLGQGRRLQHELLEDRPAAAAHGRAGLRGSYRRRASSKTIRSTSAIRGIGRRSTRGS